jgi:predicted secreted acid phosphatase
MTDNKQTDNKLDKRLLFKKGSKIQICGSSGSGKTFWLANYLLNVDTDFQEIIWVTNELSAKQDLIKKLQSKFGDKFILMIGLEKNQAQLKLMFNENKEDKINTACIIDDLMMEQSKFQAELFLAGRHLNITIFELIQSIFVGGKNSRNQQNNVQYFILFNFPDAISVVNLAHRMTTSKKGRDEVVEAYKDATNKKGGCLIIDTITSQSDLEDAKLLRFRDTELDIVYKNLADA